MKESEALSKVAVVSIP